MMLRHSLCTRYGSRKCTSKLTRGSGARPFPVRTRGSSESHIRTRRAKAASVPGNAFVMSNDRMVGNTDISTRFHETSVLPVIRPQSDYSLDVILSERLRALIVVFV